jgi:SH3-like domain-containing protein
MQRTRTFLAGCLIIAGAFPNTLAAEFPYEGIVSIERGSLKVRSGPSENHYPTGILQSGDRVIVVAEAADGWLAIEPPNGSFSWISGEFVRETGATEAEVTGNNVLVRIGTPMDDRLREYPQVKLKKGVVVRILDQKVSGEGPLAKVWYKIAPPAGEVRYVSAQFVQAADGSRPTARRSKDRAAPEPTGKSHSAARDPMPHDEPEGDPAREPKRSTGNDAAHADVLDQAEAAYHAMLRRKLADRDPAAVRRLYEKAAQSARNDDEHDLIAQRLDQLATHEDRHSRISEFDELLRRSRERDSVLLAMKGRMEPPPEPTSNPEPADVPRYNASGLLRKSIATIDGQPAFILVGRSGTIRYYATAAPGIDLAKYLGQTVAIRGSTRYCPEVRGQHVMVREVTAIEYAR